MPVSVGLHLQPAIQFKEVPMGRDLFRQQRLWFRKRLVYKTEYLLRRAFILIPLSHWLSNDLAGIILKARHSYYTVKLPSKIPENFV